MESAEWILNWKKVDEEAVPSRTHSPRSRRLPWDGTDQRGITHLVKELQEAG